MKSNKSGVTATFEFDKWFDAPTRQNNDVVIVIRCKDCKWHIKGGFCDLYFADRAADEYCSRAERKEEWRKLNG